jgi:subfamily B ATP-binding cassette protein MsbA
MATPELTSGKLYLRLLGYVMPYWRMFAASLLAMVVVAATEPALPALLKPMLDGTFVNRDPVWIRWVPILIILIAVVRGVANYCGTYTINWVGTRLVMDLRNAMFRKLLVLPTSYYDDNPTGNLISKLTYDVMQVTNAATNVVTIFIKDLLSIVGLLAWLFYLNWKLTFLVLVMTPLIVYVVRKLSVRLRRSSRDAQQAMGDITQVLEEAIDGHKVVKLFGGQHYEGARFGDQTNRVRRYTMKQAIAAAANVPIVQLIAAVALAVIIYLSAGVIASREVTVGSFVSFISAMLMLTSPLKRITGVNEFVQKGLAAAESIFGLLDREAEPDPGTVELPRARGEVRFENVGFTYPGAARPALEAITFDIRPGQTLALVGASGSGKTTLANLLPRFYHPTHGRILIDGHDTETLKLASLRSNLALVSQDIVLFNDTIAANIAYGAMNDVRPEAIVAAAEAAHAMAFIRAMPEELNTLVGENGVKLSGGERQRIAIARALLKDAPILILDEATSHLDSESERHVQAALETLMKSRTTLVIAHRLSTIENADRILVMDTGRIVEAGTHYELLERDGAYARLYRIQFESGAETVGVNPEV